MIPHRKRLATSILVLAGASTILLLVIGPDSAQYAAIGFILGTLFGQTTVAAAWTAFGPLPFLWRLPLALGWVCLLDLALCLRMSAAAHIEVGIMGIITISVIGQWLLVQIPFWVLVWTCGWQLGHHNEPQLLSTTKVRQFSIRQLMIFTAFIALLMGIGRIALTQFATADQIRPNDEMVMTFLFLMTCAILMTLPLVLAGLMPRLAIPAVMVLILLIGAATMWEKDVLISLMSTGGQVQTGPDYMHLVWINVFTCGWEIIYVIAIRWNGYYLMPARSSPSVEFNKASG